MSDLAEKIVTAPLELDQKPSHDLQILRASFNSVDAGAVVVAFDGILDNLIASVAHPVSVTISGALMTMPPQISLRPSERRGAVAAGRFVLAAFCTVCEGLDPLYGAIQVEVLKA